MEDSIRELIYGLLIMMGITIIIAVAIIRSATKKKTDSSVSKVKKSTTATETLEAETSVTKKINSSSPSTKSGGGFWSWIGAAIFVAMIGFVFLILWWNISPFFTESKPKTTLVKNVLVCPGDTVETAKVNYDLHLEANGHLCYVWFTSKNGGWTEPILVTELGECKAPPDARSGPLRITGHPEEKECFYVDLYKKIPKK